MSTLYIGYIFYSYLEAFKKESRLLLLILNRYGIYKDIRLNICKYLSVLHNILPLNTSKIETVIFGKIDRGLYDYKSFTYFFKYFIPNMKQLCLEQTYSMPSNENISFFIKELRLKKLHIIDCYGEEWINIDWKKILEVMPKKSQYRFTLLLNGDDEQTSDELILNDSNLSKKLIVVKHDDSDGNKKQCKLLNAYDYYCNNILKKCLNKISGYIAIM